MFLTKNFYFNVFFADMGIDIYCDDKIVKLDTYIGFSEQ